MRLNLEIPNNAKGQALLDFLKSLDFIKISNELENDFTIPESHKNLLNERIESYKKNPSNLKDFKSTLDELRKKL